MEGIQVVGYWRYLERIGRNLEDTEKVWGVPGTLMYLKTIGRYFEDIWKVLGLLGLRGTWSKRSADLSEGRAC